MKHLFLLALLIGSVGVYAEDSAEKQQKKPVYQELKEPFNSMNIQEQKETGVAKLTSKEQTALIKWLESDKSKKEESNSDAQEVSIVEIQEGGKIVFFSDGTKLTFDPQGRKKTKNWVEGDKIAIGGTGRRGALNVYHLATGAKVKGHRDQAPTEQVAIAKKK